MIAKTFEIRDAGTFIPVLAVKLQPGCEKDRYLLARAGYGRSPEDQSEYVLLSRIAGGFGHCTSDPYAWPGGARTIPFAHKYIIANFDRLEPGAVIDVEFLLGESAQAKPSEQEKENSYGL